MKGNGSGPVFAPYSAVAGAGMLALLALSGCDKIPFDLFSRGGTDLAVKQVETLESTYQVTVESTMPSLTSSGTGAVSATLKLKMRCKASGPKDADGVPIQGDILESQSVQGGKPWPMQIAGQRIAYRYSSLRRISQWQGVGAIPAGPELFDLGVPKGRVKAGESWKVESDRFILQLAESVRINRNFTIKGEQQYSGRPCLVIESKIPPVNKKLASGATIELSGKGETWISSKDGRILRATESIQGSLLNQPTSNQAVPFSQTIEVSEVSVATVPPPAAPTPLTPSAAAKPAPSPLTPQAPSAVPAPAPSKPTGLTPVAAPATPPAGAKAPVAPPAQAKAGTQVSSTQLSSAMQERIVFVSKATGKREIWAVSADGKRKKCLTGFTYEHWAPAFDPTGKVLACATRRTNGINLWTMNLETQAASPITEFGENANIKAGWSNGGQKLVFIKDSKLWAVHRDGYNLQTFDIDGPVVDFDTNSNTSLVAVVVNLLNQMKVQVVDVNSGSVRDLFAGDSPCWSPDGQRMIYRDSESISVARSDGTGARQVFKGRIMKAPMRWDPKGRKIALTIQEGETGSPNIYLINDIEVNPVVTVKVTSRGGVAQCFSPAGDRIAYILRGNLWHASLDGSEQVQMTSDGACVGDVKWGMQYVGK